MTPGKIEGYPSGRRLECRTAPGVNFLADIRLTTERLELIAATPEMVRAEIEDRPRFSRLLGARVPEKWPPPLNDEESMRFALRYLEAHPGAPGWMQWYFILRGDGAGGRVAIGNGGFKGNPTPDGMVEVGYSVLEEYQKVGLGTEAVQALLSWAFGHPEVTRVTAETFPDLTPSIRVLKKTGFVLIGKGSEERTIRFELPRTAYERR